MLRNVLSAAVMIGALSVKIIALVLMIGPDVLNALYAGEFCKFFFPLLTVSGDFCHLLTT